MERSPSKAGTIMQKTFCDRCEKQCVNTVVAVAIATKHQTADGQYLGTDEYKPIEICHDCATLLEGVLPNAFKLIRRDEPDSVPFIRDEDRAVEAPASRVDWAHVEIQEGRSMP